MVASSLAEKFTTRVASMLFVDDEDECKAVWAVHLTKIR